MEKHKTPPEVKEITLVDLTPPGLKMILDFSGNFVEFMDDYTPLDKE